MANRIQQHIRKTIPFPHGSTSLPWRLSTSRVSKLLGWNVFRCTRPFPYSACSFLKTWASFSYSTFSDRQLQFLLVSISTSNVICLSSYGKTCHGENCLLDWVSRRMFPTSPVWMEHEEGTFQFPTLPIDIITTLAGILGELHSRTVVLN
jgi:hypothetical protein